MLDSEINDIRHMNDFKGISFSKFKKRDVTKELLNNLIKSKIEQSCYWSAELICAGHYIDVWETILYFYSRYVHLGNPKISIYLDVKFSKFKQIINNNCGNELNLRNNNDIRELFCEIMCILCDAKRKHCFETIKITKDDFDITQMTGRLKASNTQYANDIIREEDPKELFIPINELCFNLSDDSKNIIQCCYWIEWLIEFESVCKNMKRIIKCDRRSNIPVDPKDQMDIIWIVWDIFMKISDTKTSIIQKIIKSLLSLFTVKYTNSGVKKRKYILFFIVSLLCEKIDLNEEIIRKEQKPIMLNILNKKDLIYKQIKKNEEFNDDYDDDFDKNKNKNLDKTIAKLETINNFSDSFIPRI